MLITIGRVVKPWGVRGEVKIEPLTDFPDRFRGLTAAWLVSPQGREEQAAIASVQYRNGAPYLLFAGFDSPEKARMLNGWFVKVPEEQAVPLPEGTWYWFELMGMEVVAENGDVLGTIVDIFETGSNDVYVVKRGRNEIYLPATREIVKEVDRTTRRMTVHMMDGLVD
jgi:16S rRNA processing protein RimM